jgi:hypothetical protein
VICRNFKILCNPICQFLLWLLVQLEYYSEGHCSYVCLQEKIGKNTFNIVLQDIISSTQTTIKYDDILNIAIHGEDWICKQKCWEAISWKHYKNSVWLQHMLGTYMLYSTLGVVEMKTWTMLYSWVYPLSKVYQTVHIKYALAIVFNKYNNYFCFCFLFTYLTHLKIVHSL